MNKKIINHPRPQFRRDSWKDLNGEWDFKFDDDQLGTSEKWFKGFQPTHTIQVPFVYQSELSGIGDTKFHQVIWYQKKIKINVLPGKSYFLHFEGVDYECTLWVNGCFVGNHIGGNSRFEYDIAPFLTSSDNLIVLRVQDDLTDMTIPRGKQYWKEKAEVMWFTQMSGIWRDIWLEEVSKIAISDCKMTPNIDKKQIEIDLSFTETIQTTPELELVATVKFEGMLVAKERHLIKANHMNFCIGLDDFNDHGLGRWWSPEQPNLYDLTLEILEGSRVQDHVESYFGMRKVSVEQNKFCLNNRPYFLRSVLDQGYFKESLLTAPSFEALNRDIDLMKQMGFNSVRKHMMSSESRYLYLCDCYGLLVWSEMAAAYDYSDSYALRMMDEWKAVVKNCYNHPSVVTWVPLNESWGVPDIYYSSKQQAHAQTLYYLTKSLDDTRPVISNDGWEHCKSDLFTVHDYSSDVNVLKERYSNVNNIIRDMPGLEGRKFLFCPGYEYEGQPVLCTEMGGVNFRLDGLGDPVEPRVHTEEDFLKKINQIIQCYYSSPIIEGFCYTQLTDTETEICGLLTWDRVPKAPIEKIKKIFGK